MKIKQSSKASSFLPKEAIYDKVTPTKTSSYKLDDTIAAIDKNQAEMVSKLSQQSAETRY